MLRDAGIVDMTPFEFVAILLSILFSIAIAHMMQSFAGLARAADRIRFSGLHATWSLSVFVSVLANWLSVWQLRGLEEWTTGYILLLVVAVLAQYLACVLISPDASSEGSIDLRAFHDKQGPRYLFAFGLLNIISVPLNLVTAGLFGVSAWGWQNLAQGPAAALTIAAIFVRPRWAQWAIAIAVFGLAVLYLAKLQASIR
ncbi:MAG TPA: hypothetical protein VNH64_12625 [Parvularculaceae bacterium]|nr:hypothetical protein [Parvularculaceae bacterium]